MATSAIPDALGGLLALCNGSTGTGEALDGVTVYDGPPLESPSEELSLYIGHDEERGRAAGDIYGVEGTQEFLAMGGDRNESFAIRCAASARSGDTNIKVERDRAFAVMAAVESLIRLHVSGADITLGGSVLVSSIGGDIKLMQLQTVNGAFAKVTFYVQCLARI
jgi:hypothetical protein